MIVVDAVAVTIAVIVGIVVIVVLSVIVVVVVVVVAIVVVVTVAVAILISPSLFSYEVAHSLSSGQPNGTHAINAIDYLSCPLYIRLTVHLCADLTAWPPIDFVTFLKTFHWC
uniref:Uncharacterized protein n=1 Tax=Angiostrongylus cantonensis TaxID=6313 RepID=A0A0K0DD06_ANGCA